MILILENYSEIRKELPDIDRSKFIFPKEKDIGI